MINSRVKRALITLVMLPCLAALVACGNDTSSTAPSKAFFGGAIKGAVATIKAGRGGEGGSPQSAPPQADLNALVTKALAATDGQVMILGIEASNVTLAIAPVTINGPVVTWKTPDRRGFSFNRGVLVGTRGFGDDLMSASAGPSISLITSRRGGRVARVNHYLSGEGHSAALSLDCTVTPGGASVRLTMGEINTTTTMVSEMCQRDGLKVENRYWVDARGKILKSRQWISQGMGGYIVTQQLRP